MVAVKRCETVSLGYKVGMAGGVDETMVQEMRHLGGRLSGDIRLDALKVDVVGRMLKALSGQDRFERWGKHYLLALTRSHQLQLCTNWLDAGLQVYGGELFRALRCKGDTTF